MPTFNVKKIATQPGDIGGLKRSRYERLQVSYGTIEASSYDILDTLVFTDVPSSSVVRATIVAHASPSDIKRKIYPGDSVASPITFTGVTSPVKLSYIIEYVRGSGRVNFEGMEAEDYSNFGQGDRLSIVFGDISTLSTTQVVGLTVNQIAGLSTNQIVDLTTAQTAALTTSQVEGLTVAQVGVIETRDLVELSTKQIQAIETIDIAALTTKQIAALKTAQFAALKTSQIAALETTDVKVLTSNQLKALSTSQLNALTTNQTAVLSTVQKSGLTTSQIAALQ